MKRHTVAFCAFAGLSLAACAAALPAADEGPPGGPAAKAKLLRVPDGGIQPQAAADDRGGVHLIYYKGPAAGGDVFYVRSDNGGATFSRPLRVNRQPGSALAVGSVRGAHLALGKGGRPHVAWMGSGKGRPRGPGGATPMLYTRLDDAGTAFEPERNVVTSAVGLDGGGSVAADAAGDVWVAWHAPPPGEKGEQARRVWVAWSRDEGRTFAAEEPASDERTGACGCCGMRAFADRAGRLHVLYRAAREGVHRDMLLASKDGPARETRNLGEWEINGCPMSTAALAEGPAGVLAVWETKEQVYFTTLDARAGRPAAVRPAPGDGRGRKHPAVAANARGEVILAWTEGTGWERGGSLAWQVYDKDGHPTAEKGRAEGVPVWGFAAVFARPDGGFAVVY
jgi:hypothetical protein